MSTEGWRNLREFDRSCSQWMRVVRPSVQAGSVRAARRGRPSTRLQEPQCTAREADRRTRQAAWQKQCCRHRATAGWRRKRERGKKHEGSEDKKGKVGRGEGNGEWRGREKEEMDARSCALLLFLFPASPRFFSSVRRCRCDRLESRNEFCEYVLQRRALHRLAQHGLHAR